MSREIKFRAWDKLTGRMENVKRIHLSKSTSYTSDATFVSFVDLENTPKMRDGEEVKLMQYTGLIDKYKKEIYEGDIVICILNGNAIGASDDVGFKNGSFWLNRRNIPISEWYDKDNTEFEVIGNIYQP